MNNARLQKIIDKLSENKELIESNKRGSIEINFDENVEKVTIKVVV